MRIIKNNVIIASPKLDRWNRVILSSSKKVQFQKESIINAFAKESEIFKNVYSVDRYSNFYMENSPFSTLPKRNLFSPLRLLLESTDMTKVFIEGNNPMQHAIKTNNSEAFLALYNSDNSDMLINGYNEANRVNTIGSCLSLYLKDVWESNPASLSFSYFTALAQYPNTKFDTITQIEKWSPSILLVARIFETDYQTISWSCAMELYGNKTIESLEVLSKVSEPGSIFFIQNILDRFVQNEKEKDSEDIRKLVLDTLGYCVKTGLSRSTSLILDFPNVRQYILPLNYDTDESFLHISVLTHGIHQKPGVFIDSFGTIDKLCSFDNLKNENKFGLTALMLCAMRGWDYTINYLFANWIYINNNVEIKHDYINSTDNYGRTALDYAVLSENTQSVLEANGAISGKPITVSPKNSTLLGGIEKYKTHPDYNKFPPLWLETFYGDTKAVETTLLQDKTYSQLSLDMVNLLINDFTIVGYYGLPLV